MCVEGYFGGEETNNGFWEHGWNEGGIGSYSASMARLEKMEMVSH